MLATRTPDTVVREGLADAARTWTAPRWIVLMLAPPTAVLLWPQDDGCDTSLLARYWSGGRVARCVGRFPAGGPPADRRSRSLRWRAWMKQAPAVDGRTRSTARGSTATGRGSRPPSGRSSSGRSRR